MCSHEWRCSFEKELAQAQFIDKIRERQVRSEIEFEKTDVLEESRHDFRIRVAFSVSIFPSCLRRTADETRKYSVTVFFIKVPRIRRRA